MAKMEHLGEVDLFTCPICGKTVQARLMGDLKLNEPAQLDDEDRLAGMIDAIKYASVSVKVTNMIIDHNCTRQQTVTARAITDNPQA